MRALAVLLLVACASPEPPPAAPGPPWMDAPAPRDAAVVAAIDAAVDAAVDAPVDAIVPAAFVPPPSPPSLTAGPPAGPEIWLRGSTHVHAAPSGDSATPIPQVIAWYEAHGYDFIVLTDHNRVSETGSTSTLGQVAVRSPPSGLIVLAGIELTYNPTGCLPPGDETGRCRIHVNLLGPTARPAGKLEWANRKEDGRVEKYQAALDQRQQLGGLAQLNHPNWYWGMTTDVFVELARRGFSLVEIANVQFEKWNAGDKDHPSLEQLWDAALAQGHTVWGIATDDAHDYEDGRKYPAGGGWVVVKARRDPQAILDALAAGRFYSSTGVVLERVERVGETLVIEVASTDPGPHVIDLIENGKLVARVRGRAAHRALPRAGTLRAVITRGDGKKAWVQPARRP